MSRDINGRDRTGDLRKHILLLIHVSVNRVSLHVESEPKNKTNPKASMGGPMHPSAIQVRQTHALSLNRSTKLPGAYSSPCLALQLQTLVRTTLRIVIQSL
jgi:hypothetical protein